VRLLGLGAAVRGVGRGRDTPASGWRVCRGSGGARAAAQGLRVRDEVGNAGSGWLEAHGALGSACAA
jgi:hypothetical protein